MIHCPYAFRCSRFLFLLLITLGLNFQTDAQSIQLDWAIAVGDSSGAFSSQIEVDPSGNIYVAGHFENTYDFDRGTGTFILNSAGESDGFVASYSSVGALLWAIQLEGPDKCEINTLQMDQNGDIIISGKFKGTCDFEPGAGFTNITSQGGFDLFLAKYDGTGNLVWAIGLGDVGNESANALDINASNELLLSGIFEDTVDFDPGLGTTNLISKDSFDVFILQVDASGNFQNAFSIGGREVDFSSAVQWGSLGNIIVGGYFQDTCDFAPGNPTFNLISAGKEDGFIARYQTNGILIWAIAIGDTASDRVHTITGGSNNTLTVAGSFGGTVDFDPSAGTTALASFGGSDIFLNAYDSSGALDWARQIGGLGDLHSGALRRDFKNNIYLAGSFTSVADFDPSADVSLLTSLGTEDGFFAKYDADANFYWTQQIAGLGSNHAYSLALDDSNFIFVNGVFSDTADFDPGTGSFLLTPDQAGLITDGFLGRYAQCRTDDTTNVFLCQGDTLFFGNHMITSAGMYFSCFNSIAGCDSNVTLDVSMNPIPSPSILGDANVCPLENKFYSTTAVPANIYAWTIQGGNIVNGQGTDSLEVNWGSPGPGQIIILEIDTNTCLALDTIDVTIHPQPSPNINGPDSVCANVSGIIYNTSFTVATNYNWVIGGGTITAGQNTNAITVNWGAAGIGTISLTETNSGGCDSLVGLNVVLNLKPTPNLTGLSTVCEGDSAVVYATPLSTNSFAWNVNGGTISSGQGTNSIVVNWGGIGLGSVQLTVSASSNCDSVQSLNVLVNPAPSPLMAGPDSTCENAAGIVYNTPNIIGNTYFWEISGGAMANGQGTNALTVNWGIPGSGFVKLTETHSSGCAKIDSFSIWKDSIPRADFTYTLNAGTVTLTDLSYGETNEWVWNFGDGKTDSTQHPVHLYDSSASYVLCLSARNACGQDLKCDTIQVAVGLDEILFREAFIVFPNPNHGTFNIQASLFQSENFLLEIFSLEGKKVYQKELLNAKNIQAQIKLDLDGQFILKLTGKEGSVYKKLIVLPED